MAVVQTLGDHDARADDLASFLLERDAVYIGGQPGFVDSTLRVTDNVGSGDAFEWASLAILNNRGGSGEDVASYAQANAYANVPWNFGQVVEARNMAPDQNSVSQVVQELDAVGKTRVITDAIAKGPVDFGLRILPSGADGHISTAIVVNADTAIIDQNPADHFLYVSPVQNAGIAIVGGHFLFVEQGHVAAAI